MNWLVLSLFLYFPEDKSEYIPAAIWMIVAFIAAIFVMRFIIKLSKKEAEQTPQQTIQDEQNK
jgi:flagellar biosynthesis/type III secretory pathway M-ring protein FliF/YscJ